MPSIVRKKNIKNDIKLDSQWCPASHDGEDKNKISHFVTLPHKRMKTVPGRQHEEKRDEERGIYIFFHSW